MKTPFAIAGVLFGSLLIGWQDPAIPRTATPPDGVVMASASATQDAQKPKVSDADLKKLSEAFVNVFPPDDKKKDDDPRKKEQARSNFTKEFERIDKAVKPGALLAMPEVWSEVFYARRATLKAPSGLGRVEEKVITGSLKGVPFEFRYGLLLPNGFDVKKRYPLIIALHDKAARDEKVSGPKYLEEVWMKVPPAERDKFIIMAPTMGPASAGKEHRVEWGDRNHLTSIYRPLKDLLAAYPIDNDRIYLDGVGDGGEFAFHLALYKPQLFAAVAVRSAVPRSPQLIENGAALPILAAFRVGTPVQSGQPKANLAQNAQVLGIPLEIKEYPAPDKPARSPFASDIIPEATADVIAFFGQKTRNLAPRKFAFQTDTAMFRECYWTQLLKHETGERFAKLSAAVDPASNTIDVKTEGVEEFKIYLNDRIVDLNRPVKVNVNGLPHTERQFTRSLDTFLKYFSENMLDPALQPSAVVEITVAATPSDTKQPTDPKPEPPK